MSDRTKIIEIAVIVALGIAAAVMGAKYVVPPEIHARGAYWQKVAAPVRVTAVMDVEYPVLYCQHWSLGCFDWRTGVVYLKSGMDPALRECVLGHEATSPQSHANGWDHPGFNEPGFAVDCGNGEMVPV